MKGVNGEVVTGSDVVRWSEHFERLMNVFYDQVANVEYLGCRDMRSERHGKWFGEDRRCGETLQ